MLGSISTAHIWANLHIWRLKSLRCKESCKYVLNSLLFLMSEYQLFIFIFSNIKCLFLIFNVSTNLICLGYILWFILHMYIFNFTILLKLRKLMVPRWIIHPASSWYCFRKKSDGLWLFLAMMFACNISLLTTVILEDTILMSINLSMFLQIRLALSYPRTPRILQQVSRYV